MSNYLLDTNIIIYFLKGESVVSRFFKSIRSENPIIYCSFISKLEILSLPDITSEELKNIEGLLKEFIIVGYNSIIENLTIQIRKQKHIKLPDALISASAIYTNANWLQETLMIFNTFPIWN